VKPLTIGARVRMSEGSLGTIVALDATWDNLVIRMDSGESEEFPLLCRNSDGEIVTPTFDGFTDIFVEVEK
jgi:ribosomal protein L2